MQNELLWRKGLPAIFPGILGALWVIFYNAPIGPLGFSAVLVFFTFFFLLAIIGLRSSFLVESKERSLFVVALFFGFTILFPSLLDPSRLSGDLRYLVSWVKPFLIFFVLLQFGALYYKQFSLAVRSATVISGFIIATGWIFGGFYFGDFYFTRSVTEDSFLFFTPLGNPNQLTRSAIGVIALLLYFLIVENRKKYLILIILLSLAIISTLSRSGIFGLFLFLVLFLSFSALGSDFRLPSKKGAKNILPIFGIILILIITASQNENLKDRFLDRTSEQLTQVAEGETSGARVRMWASTFEIITDNPLLGIGYSNLTEVLEEKGSLTGKGEVVLPHGGYLEILSASGGGALLFMLFIFIYILNKNFLVWRNSISLRERKAALLLGSFLLTFMLINIVNGTFRSEIFWAVMGCLAVFAWKNPVSYRQLVRVGPAN